MFVKGFELLISYWPLFAKCCTEVNAEPKVVLVMVSRSRMSVTTIRIWKNLINIVIRLKICILFIHIFWVSIISLQSYVSQINNTHLSFCYANIMFLSKWCSYKEPRIAASLEYDNMITVE